MNKILMAVAAVVIVAGVGGWYFWSHPMPGLGGTPAPATTNAGDTVATVNGASITQSQLTAAEAQLAAQNQNATSTAAQAQIQEAALNSLIGRALVEQAAQKAGVTASSTLVDAQMAAAKAQFPTPEAYQQALTAQGLTEDALRTQISGDLMVQTYLNAQLNLSAATATEAEIKTAYDQVAATQTNLPPLAQVHDQVAQSLVQQKQQNSINALIAQLRAAADVKILIASSTPSA